MAAALFLAEPVGWRRWSAILIGFIGVVIIVRPGVEGFNIYSLSALLAIIFITTCALVHNVSAASDGELLLKKNNPADVKECWEGFNRATFAVNQGLDKIIFKPVASFYNNFPIPVKKDKCQFYIV